VISWSLMRSHMD